jgi:oligoribonuclease NrnB/cAMP/cGMP phosphodiesterase (DHH superfamily)
MENSTVLYYHNPCQDGFASMFVAMKFLKKCSIYPYSHGQEINTDFEGMTYYFVDMAPSKEIYNKLKINNNIIILDHHISNLNDYKEEIKHNKNIIIDLEKSGVGVTWEYFSKEKEMPYFLKLIQDKDLWQFKYPETKEFCEGLHFTSASTESFGESLELFEELYSNPDKINYYINLGKLLLKQKNNKIKFLTEKYIKKIYKYNSHNVCMANVENELVSDLGNKLSSHDNCDFAILWRYDHEHEKYNLSFRSNDKVDVSQICKKFGGGGHKNAAGCIVNEHPLKIFNE